MIRPRIVVPHLDAELDQGTPPSLDDPVLTLYPQQGYFLDIQTVVVLNGER